jgi:hypothetical protein
MEHSIDARSAMRQRGSPIKDPSRYASRPASPISRATRGHAPKGVDGYLSRPGDPRRADTAIHPYRRGSGEAIVRSASAMSDPRIAQADGETNGATGAALDQSIVVNGRDRSPRSSSKGFTGNAISPSSHRPSHGLVTRETSNE